MRPLLLKASPTPRLLIGFAVILGAVIFYSAFTLRQVANLRKLQSDTVERNRRDSLQLLRIQDTLNSLGLALHDVLEEPYPASAFEPQFHRLEHELSDAIAKEAALAPSPQQTSGIPNSNLKELTDSIHNLTDGLDRTFVASRAGEEKLAEQLIRGTLRPERDALAASVARMLVQNNELDQQTESEIARIYNGVERDLYTFLLATVVAISITSMALVYSNRRIFAQLGTLSEQKSILARKMITVQEEVLRSVSRELHDEFGQIFTAIGTMLRRLERKGIPPESPVHADLMEVREMTQGALEKVRSLSQMLHPAVIDDYGLEKAIEWYVPMFEKQTGIAVDYKKIGTGPIIKDETAIHVYRILQEALNNVARHAAVKRASIRVNYAPDKLRLVVEDQGKGFAERDRHAQRERRGLGLVAMRERAELVHGRLNLESIPQGGTRLSLEVPIHKEAAVLTQNTNA